MAFDDTNLNDLSQYRTAIGTMKRNYSYTVAITHVDPRGLQSQKFVTVNSNNILTQEQIIGEAQALLPTPDYAGTLGEVTGIEITGATKSAGLG